MKYSTGPPSLTNFAIFIRICIKFPWFSLKLRNVRKGTFTAIIPFTSIFFQLPWTGEVLERPWVRRW
jgi:hypothetical protein